MKIMLSAAVATAALFAASAASAQITGVYGNLGYSNFRADVDDVDDDISLGAVTGRVGARVLPWLAVEGEASFGVMDEEETAGGVTASVGLSHAVAAYAVGMFPVSPNADVFARIGYGLTQLEAEIRGPGINDSASEDEQMYAYGVGGQFFWDGLNGVRGDWTRFDFREADGELDVFSIAYVRKFGG